MEAWLTKWYERLTWVFIVVVGIAVANKYAFNANGPAPVTAGASQTTVKTQANGPAQPKAGQPDFVDNATEFGSSLLKTCWDFIKSLPAFFSDKLNQYPYVGLAFAYGVLRLLARGVDKVRSGRNSRG